MKFLNTKTLTLQKDGTTIDCAVFGSGPAPLLLIPGLSLQRVRNAALPLAFMYRVFSKEFTVFVMDKKDVIPDGYSLRDMAGDAAFVMDKLGLSSACVFGVSQGGMIAQYLAMDYPHLVRKLVLAVTASRLNDVMVSVLTNWIGLARQNDYETFVIDMFYKMYSAPYIKKFGWAFPLLSKIGKPNDFTRFINSANACLTCNSFPELHKISCPAFVIGGKQDLVVTGQASEDIAGALHCEIYMYDSLGHAAYDEAPDFNRRIYRFLTAEP